MKQGKRMTAFYLETLLLVVAFAAVILVLIQCFAASERSRRQARELNDAVYLARNAAEAAAEAGDTAELLELLGGNAVAENSAMVLRYNETLEPDGGGIYRVRISWEIPVGAGRTVSYDITVENAETGTELFDLSTAVNPRRDGP